MHHPGTNNKVYKKINDNFEWSSENFKKISEIIKKYPSNRIQSAVIPLLDLAQRQNNGWLSKNSMEKVAETLSMSYIRVLEVATFYSMFNLEPIGKNFVINCLKLHKKFAKLILARQVMMKYLQLLKLNA